MVLYMNNFFNEEILDSVLTLATCWRLTLKEGMIFGFTNADHNITINGIEYIANTGFTPSAIVDNTSLAVDNLEVEGMLDSVLIRVEDIKAGRFDHAEVAIFLVDYLHPQKGELMLRTGWLGEVSFSKDKFIVEVRGLMQAFSRKIGELYSPLCRTNFCDHKCKLNEKDFTSSGQVLAVLSNSKIICNVMNKPNNYFDYGRLKFLTGVNINIEIEVKSCIKECIELVLPMSRLCTIGDQFQIIAGCDKAIDTCINKFNNAINFRGEPHIPQIQKILFG